MIILGIDPGVGRLGYGVMEKNGARMTVLDYGCIETPKNTAQGSRLLTISKELKKILKKYKPSLVGVEKLFFSKNVKTASAVGEARGVIILMCAEHGADIAEFGPGQIKQTLTGYGNADKKQMQRMVQVVCKLAEKPQPDDAADALAVAYTAAVSHRS